MSKPPCPGGARLGNRTASIKQQSTIAYLQQSGIFGSTNFIAPANMPNLDEIKSQIKTLGSTDAILGKREINELPNILAQDEPVLNIVQGFYSGGNGILIATDRRLVFIDKGMIYGLKVEDFPYEKLSSIQYETGLLLAKITIFASGNQALIDNVDKKQARAFSEAVRERLSAPKPTAAPVVAAAADDEIIAKLERLIKLREAGILTDSELAEQKQRILSGK